MSNIPDIYPASDYLHQKPFIVKNIDDHTMGKSLKRYLEIKIHPIIESGIYERIVVLGRYDRSQGVSPKEKDGKMYNWQRPTAVIKHNILYLMCFPGMDYVRHYASIVATHLKITDRDPKIVSYLMPSENECWAPILDSNFERITRNKGLIIGFGLSKIFPNLDWKEEEIYHHSSIKLTCGVWTLLMVKHSFWGDIGGRLVTHLSKFGFSKIVFIGKLGTMDKSIEPNKFLATGNESYVEGELISWNNFFKKKDDKLIEGSHVTMPSVLFETKSWLKSISTHFRFVDPEVGQVAKACIKNNVEFSYLHIISDNISKHYDEDLSNERDHSVINKRQNIMNEIRNHLFENL